VKPWEEEWTAQDGRVVIRIGPDDVFADSASGLFMCDRGTDSGTPPVDGGTIMQRRDQERATLAAAAPSMYRALESLLEEFRAYRRHGQDALSPFDEFIKAEDVMRKARGEA
jgi:hypothetical protein